MATPSKTPLKPPSISSSSPIKRHHHQITTIPTSNPNPNPNSSPNEFRSRFEACNKLQSACVSFGEKLPIHEIVAIGGWSDGKSSLLEALLGFRFNVKEVEMGTHRPLILQMVHDVTAIEPHC